VKNSKLLNLVGSFSEKDWRKCRKLIETRRPDSKELRLFKFLKNNHHKHDSDRLSIDNLKNSTILGYNSKKNVQNIMSRLSLLIEDYMVLESYEEDKLEREYRLFKSYNDRGLFGLANKKADSLISKWENESTIDKRYFEYILKIIHHQYFSNNPIKREQKQLVIKLNQALLTSYKADKSMYTYVTNIDMALKLISDEDLQNIRPSVNRLNESYFAITSQLNNSETYSSDSFIHLYNELITNDAINNELRVIMFTHCETYLRNKAILAKNSEDSIKLLGLYEFGMKTKILTYKDKIGTTKFVNIIQVACYLKQFDWAESFQSNYGQLVAKEHVKECGLMTAMQLCFGRKNYTEAIEIILFNEIKLFTVTSRWFMISSYFITFDNLDFFESQLNNFIQFIYYNKNKISIQNFEGSLNLGKIFKAYITKQSFSLDEEISKYDNITFKTRLPEFFEERKRYIKENDIDI